VYVQYTINIYQTSLELGAKFFLKRRIHCMSEVCSIYQKYFTIESSIFQNGKCKYGGPPIPALTEV